MSKKRRQHSAALKAQVGLEALKTIIFGLSLVVFLGSAPIWLFNPGWQAALQGTASRDMVHFNALFLSRPWRELVPDAKHQVVTAGYGEENGLDYAAAARTADGSTAIVYLPVAQEITVDLTILAETLVRAWWFDPRTGAPQRAGDFERKPVVRFRPPAIGCWYWMMHPGHWVRPAAADNPSAPRRWLLAAEA